MSDDRGNPRGITPERLARSAFWATQMQEIINRILKTDTGIQHICRDALEEKFMLVAGVQAGAMDMTVPNPDGSNPFEELNLEAPKPHVVTDLPDWMKEMGVAEEALPTGPVQDLSGMQCAMPVESKVVRRTATGADLEIHRNADLNESISIDLAREKQQRMMEIDRRHGGRTPVPGIRTEETMSTPQHLRVTIPHYHVTLRDTQDRIIALERIEDWKDALALQEQISTQHPTCRVKLSSTKCQGDDCPGVDMKAIEEYAAAKSASEVKPRTVKVTPSRMPGCDHCTITIDRNGDQHHELGCPVSPNNTADPPRWATKAILRILTKIGLDESMTARAGDQLAWLIVEEFKQMQKIIFYGPHKCDYCGLGLVCRGDVGGGNGNIRYDYPQGPIYPNQGWRVHHCHAYKVNHDGYFGTEPVSNGQDYETPTRPGGCQAPSQPSSQPDGHAE